MDYVKFILYFNEKSQASLELRERLEEFLEVQCINTTTLQQRPEWLRGVPTVVTPGNKQVFTGTQAMTFVDQWISIQLSSTKSSPFAELNPGLFNQDWAPTAPYDQKPPPPDLAEYERLRGAS